MWTVLVAAIACAVGFALGIIVSIVYAICALPEAEMGEDIGW